jgi:hypothetical protein
MIASYLVALHGNAAPGFVHKWCKENGAVNVEMIIMVFVGIVIIYQLIGQVGTQNLAVQSSANVSAMGKWAAALGEWLFPVLGIIALVMLLFRKRGKGQGV